MVWEGLPDSGGGQARFPCGGNPAPVLRRRPKRAAASCGWLEYFADGSNADIFAPAIEDTANLVVPTRWINRKQLDHLHHAQHMEPERQRAAQLLWREEMQESYRKNRGEQGAQVIADLRRRAGMMPSTTELAAR